MRPEKDDISCPKRAVRLPEKGSRRDAVVAIEAHDETELADMETDLATIGRTQVHVVLVEDPAPSRRRITPARTPQRALRCVSSGYLADGCSCRSAIPADVVTAVWRREQPAGDGRDGFFRFAWRGGVWLAYGRADGGVRGVYCPEHSAEREERSFAQLIMSSPPAADLLATA
jgi:hypothetical protein